MLRKNVVSRLLNWTGPYQILLSFVLLSLLLLSISRFGLMLWQWDRVSDAGSVGWMLLQGLRADLILLGMLVAIPVLLAPFWGRARWLNSWNQFCFGWSLLALTLIIFIELSTPSFVAQYDVRPNRLYIEYL